MIIYRLGIRLYGAVIRLVKGFNSKAKAFSDGRKGWRENLSSRNWEGKVIWMHCASLGEFEQGRPVLERCRDEFPNAKILLTFFSPSGYEVRKDYKGADFVTYLPLDLSRNVKDFLDIVSPELALFVKYEVWPGYFMELSKREIPLILFSAIFRDNHRYFKPFGGVFRAALRSASHILVQNQSSKELLGSIGLNQVEVTGDTRFDRVSQIAQKSPSLEMIRAFKNDEMLLVVGSSWPAEEAMVLSYLNSTQIPFKTIFAPHEIGESRISSLHSQAGVGALRYSKMQKSELAEARILIIDNLGLLSKVYREADVAFIGGGFGKGLHNTLEAAVFGVPILAGPNHEKFKEVVDLKTEGGLYAVSDQQEFEAKLGELLKNDVLRLEAGKRCEDYVERSLGATGIIFSKVKMVFSAE